MAGQHLYGTYVRLFKPAAALFRLDRALLTISSFVGHVSEKICVGSAGLVISGNGEYVVDLDISRYVFEK